MKIKFPYRDNNWISNDGKEYHRYYPIHIQYVLNIFKYMNLNIEMVDPRSFPIRSQIIFDTLINNKLVRFDFSDFEKLNESEVNSCDLYFKFHYENSHKKYTNVFPFTPVNFHNWEEYYNLDKTILYKAKGLVLNNQTPFGAAVKRRTYVREILLNKYGNNLSYDRKPQSEFFKLINQGLVSVCVPGARNNMLDRGQCQYMGLGACTISPLLNTRLSWDAKLVPGIHYLECKDDYSDLIDKIEWVRNNPSDAILIGNNAKKIFRETSIHTKQLEWIKNILN